MCDQPVGLYIHVPFCIKLCPYCAFYKMTINKDKMRVYTNNIIIEMKHYFETYGKLKVDTLFFGGGTPNVLPVRYFEKIFESLHFFFDISTDVEISMEMNPGIHSSFKLNKLRDLGLNRVSIGVQSFNDVELNDYGRNHTTSDTTKFINDVFDVGLTNVSADILFGHPRHKLNNLLKTLSLFKRFPFTHAALYGLTIEENTPYHSSKLAVNDDQQADHYEAIQDYLNDLGYEHYEVSNFSKPAYYAKHNIKYWTFQPTIGLGAGAHSYFMGHRYSNSKDLDNYLNPIAKKLPKDYNEFD